MYFEASPMRRFSVSFARGVTYFVSRLEAEVRAIEENATHFDGAPTTSPSALRCLLQALRRFSAECSGQ
jgi:hypothetical protein